MNNRYTRIIISASAAMVLTILLALFYSVTEDGTSGRRLAVLLGGQLPAGIVQGLTYLLFFFGIMELWAINREIKEEEKAYNFRLLPEKEQYVLSPADVAQIKLEAISKEKYRKYFLTDMIKKACTKFRANKSTSEALEIVTSQSKINMADAESRQSYIRYTAWAIPSVGFIGTIIGIAQSLGFANETMTPEGISKVTSALNIAFDTTLVALFLSLILMLYIHSIQERLERFHIRMEEYVIENLINRIYKE
ncbi:MAG: MotA/TolQ/ExbB proton channel family protein [Thermaurantimonas sp.]